MEFGTKREDQDRFALVSKGRAPQAQEAARSWRSRSHRAAAQRELGLREAREPAGRRDRAGPPARHERRAARTTATYQLQRSRGRYALCTLCVGVGQAMALILERA